jgi:MSHA biogenesis protein MshO
MNKRLPVRRSGGFTLIETILVIVIIGVLGAIVAVFIRAPILGYRDTVERGELTDQADLALRRMARDIRLALPNSIRVMTTANGDVLEFLQTKNGGRYLSAEDGLGATLPPLGFDADAGNTFTALAPPDSFVAQVAAGDYVVVYNLGEGFAPGNAYDLGSPTAPTAAAPCPTVTSAGNIACITGVATSNATINGDTVRVAQITLHGNPFALQDVPLQSPEQRFHVVSGPVSYYCERQADNTFTLWRAWGYPIAAVQAVPTGGKRAMVAARLTGCTGLFGYGDAASASRRAGLLVIALGLQGRNGANTAIRLVHQVHVDNTP